MKAREGLSTHFHPDAESVEKYLMR